MKKFFIPFVALFFCGPAWTYDPYDDENISPEYIAHLQQNAKKGDAEAQYDLAEAYLKGEGVIQSDKEAAKWYYRAAQQNFVDAQVAMGFVYRGGGGIPMDKVLSYMWLDLAVKNGDDRALWMRNDLAWSMSMEEIEEGKRKSDEWNPQTTPKQYGDSE